MTLKNPATIEFQVSLFFNLTTEELSRLAGGQKLTFAKGTKTVTFSAKDLNIPLEELVAGTNGQVADITVSYN